MKHNIKITLIILVMFIITQLIGLYVVNFYLSPSATLPYGFSQASLASVQESGFSIQLLIINFIISFIIAIAIIMLLMKIKSKLFLRGWFFIVVALALGITVNILTSKLGLVHSSLFALGIGIILAYLKFFRRNVIIHNLTELLIYPGIAAIFVSIFNLLGTIILLLIISVYDIWAVWRSGIMQKMAKFQIRTLGMLGGFMIPYASKKVKNKIKILLLKYKDHKIPKKVIKKQNIIVGLAILGGGDIIFPIIAAGVFLKLTNSIPATLIVTLFASLALLLLLLFSQKKKAYPAMPYLTVGILLGMLVAILLGMI